MKWHISAYRRYKEDSLRFVKRLKRLEGEGSRLDKATIDEIRVLKQYKAEVRAHLEDARREIDINQRACRKAGLPIPDPDDVEESDIDTDEALGEATTSEDEPQPPKKKRKSNSHANGYEENRPSQSSRPVPKHKVRPEEQKAKNAFKAKILQQDTSAKTGIKLKIPRKSLSPEVTKKKDPNRPVAPTKSPEKRPPKSDDTRTPKARPQEPRQTDAPSRPATPRDQPESRPSDNRPKPRKRAKQPTGGSPSKEADATNAPREGNVARPDVQEKPRSHSGVPREKSIPPAPIASTSGPSPTPAPLFLDAPDVSKRIKPRSSQWAIGADSPGATKVVHDAPQTGLSAEEAVVVDTLPSPGPSAPLPVKAEPQSPGGAYSGSEGEVEHDLGLDAEANEATVQAA